MAVYDGFLVSFGTVGASVHLDLAYTGGRDPINNSQRNGDYDVEPYGAGARTDNTPVSSIPIARQGFLAPTFRTDWYGRVHVVPSNISLGNLLSSQERDVEVWNGHFEQKLLSEIQEQNTDDIVLTEPEIPPTYFAGLESRPYKVNISTNGSPVIDAKFIFVFPEESPALSLTGRRVVVWPFVPQTGNKELMEWKTDIIASFSNEQRIALRDAPRQAFSYEFQLDEHQFSRAKAIANQWSHRVYGIPVWTENTEVGTLSLGQTEIIMDTANADYRENDIILVWENDEKFLAVENTDVLPDRIVLKLPLELSFQKAYVCPMRFARTLSGIQFSRDSHYITEAKSTFTVTENADLSLGMGLPTYRGKDVLNERTVVTGRLTEKVSRAVDEFDNGSGPIAVEVTRDWLERTRVATFDALDRETLWRYRRWIHSMKGRQGSFWLPSWNPDINVLEDIGEAATSMIASPIGYPLYYGTTDIVLFTKDGQELYNRILSASTDQDGNEILAMTSSFGVAIPVSNISMVCFMDHVRFDTDRVTIDHQVSGRSTISVPVKETPE